MIKNLRSVKMSIYRKLKSHWKMGTQLVSRIGSNNKKSTIKNRKNLKKS